MKLLEFIEKLNEGAYLHVHEDGRRVVNDQEDMGEGWTTKKLRDD